MLHLQLLRVGEKDGFAPGKGGEARVRDLSLLREFEKLRHRGFHKEKEMNKGFTLIELMIVVAIIAIIAAIAIPSLLESKKAANEAAAISAMRTISSAEELYMARAGEYGLNTNLNDGTRKLIDSVLRDAYTSNAHPKSGYFFDITVSGTGSAWSCIAEPSEWATTGERNFMISTDGVIYWNGTKDDITTWTSVLGGG
jgi:prepilin-type N-terminal cleavage/methylation domain-containing protein